MPSSYLSYIWPAVQYTPKTIMPQQVHRLFKFDDAQMKMPKRMEKGGTWRAQDSGSLPDDLEAATPWHGRFGFRFELAGAQYIPGGRSSSGTRRILISAFIWFGLFIGPKLVNIDKARRASRSVHMDRFTEWLAMFTILFIILLVVVSKGGIHMPPFTYFIGLAFSGHASDSVDLRAFGVHALGLFNELIYGYMIMRVINVWYDCYPLLEDQKIAHYLHLPPRAATGMQILAAFVGLPVNWESGFTMSKYDYLTGIKTDLTGEWSAQRDSSPTTSILPSFMGFLLVGAIAPFIIWLAHRRFPRWSLDKCNTTIFFASSATFWGNISTGPLTSIIIGTVWNFYLFRYRHYFWKMWAYISGAELDTGFNTTILFIFVTFGSTGGYFALELVSYPL
ncbi:OPT oligopeptide transporter protein-domain-containing protein [Mycena olivaceomarginata]|nr:OPT oligopeptide transporter protein-domain-containing protein [Mycena olivaceomarginata]